MFMSLFHTIAHLVFLGLFPFYFMSISVLLLISQVKTKLNGTARFVLVLMVTFAVLIRKV